jgi:BASS family bile acid:Na+ symporter
LIATAAAKAVGLGAPLTAALVLWSGSPPLASSPAIAQLIGLDAALALLAIVIATFAMPVTLPPLALGLIGVELGIGILPLMGRLALFTGGAWLAAWVLRRTLGAARLRRRSSELNAVNVVLLHLFAIAAMDGVGALALSEPGTVAVYAATTFTASLGLQALSFLAFAWLDRAAAPTVALVGGNRNMAVVWANLGSAATPELMLFFALMQLPIYALPILLAPIYRRLAGTGGLTATVATGTSQGP